MDLIEAASTQGIDGWRTFLRAAVRASGAGDEARAERLLDAAGRLAPERPEVALALGRLRARQGRCDEAERLLRRAWLGVGNATAAAALARLLAHSLARSGEALRVLDEAAQRVGGSALLDCVRGEVLLASDDVAGARAAFERALARKPDCHTARVGMARVLVAEALDLMERCEATRSLFLLRRAAGLDPSWAMPHRAMAVAFEAIGCGGLAERARQTAAAST